MKKPLYHEITVEEMLYIREHEHLTNKQIAIKLGCSYPTVLKYIGKQPKEEPKRKDQKYERPDHLFTDR